MSFPNLAKCSVNPLHGDTDFDSISFAFFLSYFIYLSILYSVAVVASALFCFIVDLPVTLTFIISLCFLLSLSIHLTVSIYLCVSLPGIADREQKK